LGLASPIIPRCLSYYHEGRDYLKKAKFHYEAAALAGQEGARFNIGMFLVYIDSGNMERAVKHWIIAASSGNHHAMDALRTYLERGLVCRESIDSTKGITTLYVESLQ
jgi:TPR repeat protein